jgi:hypothetical protein
MAGVRTLVGLLLRGAEEGKHRQKSNGCIELGAESDQLDFTARVQREHRKHLTLPEFTSGPYAGCLDALQGGTRRCNMA